MLEIDRSLQDRKGVHLSHPARPQACVNPPRKPHDTPSLGSSALTAKRAVFLAGPVQSKGPYTRAHVRDLAFIEAGLGNGLSQPTGAFNRNVAKWKPELHLRAS